MYVSIIDLLLAYAYLHCYKYNLKFAVESHLLTHSRKSGLPTAESRKKEFKRSRKINR